MAEGTAAEFQPINHNPAEEEPTEIDVAMFEINALKACKTAPEVHFNKSFFCLNPWRTRAWRGGTTIAPPQRRRA